MALRLSPFLLTVLLLACPACAAAPHELVVIHKTQTVPVKGAPSAAEHFQMQLGRALGKAAGRQVRFLELPRNRMVEALEAGEGDILCGYLPEWMPGAMDWSRAFIPVTDVLLSSPRVPAPRAIGELKDKRIGTVLGFRYPDFERSLGDAFVRDNAQSESMSIQKMVAGRFDYVITTQATVDTQTRRGNLPAHVHVLVLKDFRTSCAVSRRGRVSVADIDRAIDRLERSGELARLLRAR